MGMGGARVGDGKDAEAIQSARRGNKKTSPVGRPAISGIERVRQFLGGAKS